MNEKLRSNGLPTRRLLTVVTTLAVLLATAVWFGARITNADNVNVVVYKTPTCGCCGKWVAHLEDHGFEVNVVNVSSTRPAQQQFGVPQRLGSCHTAQIGEYWVEGHVPADLIERLIAEQPDDIRGLAVPGMPIGSPGMEGPNPVTYEVLAYGSDGRTTVYATRQGRDAPQ